MSLTGDIRAALIAKTLRVPAVDGPSGDGAAAARQLDVALMSVGFKCSRELLEHLSGLHPAAVHEAGEVTLRAARRLVGDHVQHNPYFIDFPANVPDTVEFWSRCVAEALTDPGAASRIAGQLRRGIVNLLDLPSYGRVQHTYTEMLARHEALVPSVEERFTVLALGQPLAKESHAVYLALAGSPVPLVEDDLALLGLVAGLHVGDEQPETIPMRENRALVNRARLDHGLAPDVDTTTDVLRLACALSDGDVTLTTPTRLRSLRRAERRALLAALDAVIRANPAKLADVSRHAEPLKRLGERLHPHEYPQWGAAQDVFAVARGERTVRSLAGRFEVALAADGPDEAVKVLANAPGMLVRTVDRLARAGADPVALAETVRVAAPDVATRVLLSLREHLLNREQPAAARIFVNQQGRSWVAADERAPLPADDTEALRTILDEEIARRLPRIERLVVDPQVRALTVPLSEKTKPKGIGVLPRGSVLPATPNLRFFVFWKEHERTTDYDLSVLLLDEHFHEAGQVSWTNLRGHGVVHSGDITEAPDGATEFIDLDLSEVDAAYVVPQVHIYSGEGFDRVEEAFFGFMQRDPEQKGRPFEPRTVRAKSDLFGTGRVSLPVIFARGKDGDWHAKWMHLTFSGWANFNRVEGHGARASQMVRAVVGRRYLGLSYLEDLLRAGGTVVEDWPVAPDGAAEPFTYLGLEYRDDLPQGTTVITPQNLVELLSSA